MIWAGGMVWTVGQLRLVDNLDDLNCLEVLDPSDPLYLPGIVALIMETR